MEDKERYTIKFSSDDGKTWKECSIKKSELRFARPSEPYVYSEDDAMYNLLEEVCDADEYTFGEFWYLDCGPGVNYEENEINVFPDKDGDAEDFEDMLSGKNLHFERRWRTVDTEPDDDLYDDQDVREFDVSIKIFDGDKRMTDINDFYAKPKAPRGPEK